MVQNSIDFSTRNLRVNCIRATCWDIWRSNRQKVAVELRKYTVKSFRLFNIQYSLPALLNSRLVLSTYMSDEKACIYFSCKTRRKGTAGDVGAVWKIILKCDGSLRRCFVDYTKLANERSGKVYCEHGNEDLGSIKCGEFLGHPGEHHLLKTESSPYCWLMSVTLSTTDKYQWVNENN